MDYFNLLNLKTEPFANTPDPRLFYASRQHLEVLQQLEIAIRLKRGLNVITGDVGTGKTTLSRQLMGTLSPDDTLDHHLILDPGFNSVNEFLDHIHTLMTGASISGDAPQIKEAIKSHLFSAAVDKNKNTVLIIDEGQKLSAQLLEALRELLNFETNDNKLLQIVIFAQTEFETLLDRMENVRDRINFKYHLNPLGFKESKALIQYRLGKSFSPGKTRALFSHGAYLAIYKATQGSPRKIINLCHQVLLAMIIKESKKAGYFLVRSCVLRQEAAPPAKAGTNTQSLGLYIGLTLVVIMAASFFLYPVTPANSPKEPPKAPVKQTATVPEAKPPVAHKIKPRTAPSTVKPVMPAPLDNAEAERYGWVQVPKKATLYRLLKRVYGIYSNEMVDRFMAFNPQLGGPDQVSSGMRIYFPDIQGAAPIPEKGVALILLEATDFGMVLSQSFAPGYRDLDLRVVPINRPDRDRTFILMVNKAYATPSEASERGNRYLPDLPKATLDLADLIHLIHPAGER